MLLPSVAGLVGIYCPCSLSRQSSLGVAAAQTRLQRAISEVQVDERRRLFTQGRSHGSRDCHYGTAPFTRALI